MPPRINHRWVDGTEKKWCSDCKTWLDLSLFHTTGTKNPTWDGLFYICAICELAKRKITPSRRAAEAWKAIVRRVTQREDYRVKGIELRCTKEEFTQWYNELWFPGCLVDRKENSGHYELSNMQLVSLEDHNYKLRMDNLSLLGIVEPEGFRYCYGCETMKFEDDYYGKTRKISKVNPLGLDEHCKECRRGTRNQRYKELKR